MADHVVIGKTGRVITPIAPGVMGEVVIPIRGGTEAYYAVAYDDDETIPTGRKVVVLDLYPPRTVAVSQVPI